MNVRNRPVNSRGMDAPADRLILRNLVMTPVPLAEVVTGGVSSLPFKLTLMSFAKADPALTTNAAAVRRAQIRDVLTDRFMS